MDPVILQELKTALEQERGRLRKELESIAAPNPRATGDWTTKFPKFEEGEQSPDSDLEESADEVEEYQERLAAEGALEERLLAVERAPSRIAADSYGLSVKTGKPLPMEQLRANPAAEEEVVR